MGEVGISATADGQGLCKTDVVGDLDYGWVCGEGFSHGGATPGRASWRRPCETCGGEKQCEPGGDGDGWPGRDGRMGSKTAVQRGQCQCQLGRTEPPRVGRKGGVRRPCQEPKTRGMRIKNAGMAEQLQAGRGGRWSTAPLPPSNPIRS